MKKIFLISLIFACFSAAGQSYTYIGNQYEWLGGLFRKLGLPAGSGPAAFQTGQRQQAGAVYYDSTGVDSGLYVYSGLAWLKLSTGSGAVPTLQQVFNTEVGGSVLTKTDTINTGNSFRLKIGDYNGVTNHESEFGFSGAALRGVSIANVGLWGVSQDFAGVSGETNATTTSPALQGLVNSSGAATIQNGLSVQHANSAGAASNGIGVSVSFQNETTSNGAMIESNRIISRWDDATDANPTSGFFITGKNGGTQDTIMDIQHSGIVRVNNNADTLATKADVRSAAGSGNLRAERGGAGTPIFYVEDDTILVLKDIKPATVTATTDADNSLLLNITDGDYGDLTFSGSGATATINNAAVSYAKIQNVTQARLLGRYTASNGPIQEITLGSGLALNSSTGELTATSSGGITSLNGLTGTTQTFATGTTGTDFNISSVGSAHTFNLPDASETVRGAMNATTQAFAGQKTFSGNLIGTATISSGTVGTSSNFFVASGAGSATTTLSQLIFGGAGTVRYRVASRGSSTASLVANESLANWIFGTEGVIEAGSGTHAVVASVAVNPLSITDNTANTTNATTLYIKGPPTGITPTDPVTSFFIDDGVARLDGGILGTRTNDNAATGIVGEYVSSLIASGSAVALTTATSANVTSISLTAGDWDVEGNISYAMTGATSTQKTGGITSTSATLPADGSEVNNANQTTTLTANDGLTVSRKRFSLSATTTVYLIAQATFSAGTISAYGSITARRIR